jgi:hypothetical protein
MRRPLTTLTLVTCGVLVLGAGLAVAIGANAGARLKRGATASVGHSWPVSMSAAPSDLTLAEVSFREPRHGRRIPGTSLQVTVGVPFGDDYVAAATPRVPTSGVVRVLVLLVNRPSPLLDPASVSVRLTAPRALGVPLVLRSADPLSRSAAARAPALCKLAPHGDALSASALWTLRSRGEGVAGLDAASALAQAYDMVCGLPYMSSFAQAVAGSSPAPAPLPSPPESTPPAPSPSPPVGKVPGEGCVPTPGYACPAAYRGSARAAVVEGLAASGRGRPLEFVA